MMFDYVSVGLVGEIVRFTRCRGPAEEEQEHLPFQSGPLHARGQTYRTICGKPARSRFR